jgi:transcriptional regulator with XRE-family HTH domain
MAAKVDVESLYATLDATRKSKGLSWRQLAQQAGVSPSTLTRMAQGKRPDVDGFAALVGWLGLPADRFMQDENAGPTSSQEEPVAYVVSYLRARKDLDDETVEALGDILQAAYKRLVAEKP